MTTSSFDPGRAESYDVRVQKMIPGYEVLHRIADVFLSAELPQTASILKIGPGTNLKALPSGNAFDAATLMFVLHLLPDNGAKEELLTEIAGRLKPGAPLFLASYFGEIETTRTKKLFDLTKAWCLNNGMDAKEVEEKIDPTRSDMHLVPEDRMKALFRYAGFIDVQRIYQGLLIGGWVARTPR